jgi:hypothetical protein
MATVGRPPTCDCGECRKCKQRVYMRAWWRQQSPEYRRATVTTRDPERTREQDRRKQARRRKSGTPEQKQKIHARAEVRKARLRGDLVQQPCEVCGDSKSHAHHDDYDKPLEVRWLCRPHHEALHA